jgi:Protein of unknown function (DUF2637).
MNSRDWPAIGRRIGYVIGFGVVAGIAAWASYWHQVDVATLAHQPAKLAYALPLSVDGMLVVAAMAMGEDKANNRHPRGWARFAFWLGAVVSVTANITSTTVHYGDPISVAVSAWAPICFLASVEIVSRKGKAKSGTSQALAAPAPAIRVVPEPVVEAQRIVDAEVTRLPVPVSPAPQGGRSERSGVSRTGPLVSGPSRKSPLTGRVLIEEPPKV